MYTTVHCTVTDCIYWGDWNYCAASAILVMAGGVKEGIDPLGTGADQMEGTPAAEKTATLCYTYQRAE